MTYYSWLLSRYLPATEFMQHLFLVPELFGKYLSFFLSLSLSLSLSLPRGSPRTPPGPQEHLGMVGGLDPRAPGSACVTSYLAGYGLS